MDEIPWADPEGVVRGNRSEQVTIGFLRNIGKDHPLSRRAVRMTKKRYQDPLTDFGPAHESVLKKKVSEYDQEIPQS